MAGKAKTQEAGVGAAETRRVAELQQEKVEQAAVSVRAARAGGQEAELESAQDPVARNLKEAERLLAEARGIGETIGDRGKR